MSGYEDLAKAAWTELGQEAHEFNGAIVTSVNADGTVNLRYLGEDHFQIEAMTSYLDRLAGDFVLVRSHGDHWTVIGKMGNAYDPQDHVIFPPIPPPPVMPPSVTWGNADPGGAGWSTIISTWSNDDGRIYHKRGTITTTPPPPVVQPPTPPATPTVYTIVPQAVRNFRNESEPWNGVMADLDLQYVNSDIFDQGLYTDVLFGATVTGGPYASAWYYGNDLPTAADKNPSKMEVWISRLAIFHGTVTDSIAVKPTFYLHGQTAPGATLDLLEGPFAGPSLSKGQGTWWPVPSSVLAAWKTGSGSGLKGISIWSNKANAYFISGADFGNVRVTP